MSIPKKLLSLAAALVIVLACAGMALAAETGTINVTNAKQGQTYSVYQLLALESYDTTNDAYAYKVADGWTGFFNQTDVKGTYVTIDDQGYVTWKTGADQAAFAQKAAAYASAHQIVPTARQEAGAPVNGKVSIAFTGLPLGYYLMDSTMGALCSLDTTNPTVSLEEKNFEPTLEKKVNRGGEAYDSRNTAKVGDTVLFRTVVSADKGAENYVVHDTMSDGLTFVGIPETVASGTEPGIYFRHSGSTDTTGTPLTEDVDYKLIHNPGDGCTFHVEFTSHFLNQVTDKIFINIHYTATLNEMAVIGDGGNGNSSYLSYGDNMRTETAATNTYTYQFDLVKIDSGKRVLNGATFKLYDAKTGGNEIKLVYLSEGEYRVASARDIADPGFQAATITAGVARIQGLGNGAYYLEEITAPNGYNKLAERSQVTIADADNNATLNADKSSYISGGISIVNQTGTILPSTGDAGAFAFYIIGGIAVACGVVLLVMYARKRRVK